MANKELEALVEKVLKNSTIIKMKSMHEANQKEIARLETLKSGSFFPSGQEKVHDHRIDNDIKNLEEQQKYLSEMLEGAVEEPIEGADEQIFNQFVLSDPDEFQKGVDYVDEMMRAKDATPEELLEASQYAKELNNFLTENYTDIVEDLASLPNDIRESIESKVASQIEVIATKAYALSEKSEQMATNKSKWGRSPSSENLNKSTSTMGTRRGPHSWAKEGTEKVAGEVRKRSTSDTSNPPLPKGKLER